ncbi:MAG: MOSC domain-containing protein [Bacteroidota bacterium]
MQVIATNIGTSKTVLWRGRKIKTGIYKKPVIGPIYLGKEDVRNDAVVDRKHHGGEHKACYLFGANHYHDWKLKYPNLDWDWGMFGENLTVDHLDENKLQIGAIYGLGSAVVQITEPRQPCYKLGIKFGTQKVIREFLEYAHPGTYVRILKEGEVIAGDPITLQKEGPNSFSVAQYNTLINQREKDKVLVALAVANKTLREEKRKIFRKYL